MRRHDPQVQEGGFSILVPIALDVLPRLVEAYEGESDHGIRCWLLELIGLAKSEDALPILAREMRDDDESIRDWTRRGLNELNTKEARTILWRDAQEGAGRAADRTARPDGDPVSGQSPALSPGLTRRQDGRRLAHGSATGVGPGQLERSLSPALRR